MSFNPSKCNIMHVSRKRKPLNHNYTLKGEILDVVDTATYLGVNIAKDLSWNSQVAKATAKANKSLGFIKRNVNSTSAATKELAYTALVHPTIEYASTVWDPHQKCLVDQAEMVQRRAARYVMRNYDPRASVTKMLADLKWESLEQRRLKARVTMAFKIKLKLIAMPSTQFIKSEVPTRGNQEKYIQLPGLRNYYKYSFFPAVIPLWNQLPNDAAQAKKLEEFKRKLSTFQLTRIRRG